MANNFIKRAFKLMGERRSINRDGYEGPQISVLAQHKILAKGNPVPLRFTLNKVTNKENIDVGNR